MKSEKTSWGAVADWYDELVEESEDSYQKKVIMPNLARIVDPSDSMTIVDVACGQGYFARAFASNGAAVIGCDISPELIEKAKTQVSRNQEKGGNDIAYHVAPADDMPFIVLPPFLRTLTLC